MKIFYIIQHSCVPNARVRYTTVEDFGLMAEVVAITPINAGEELLQSYIESTAGMYKA